MATYNNTFLLRLLALTFLVGLHASLAASDVTLKSIVNEEPKVSLTSISGVKKLIEQAENDQNERTKKFKDSFSELLPILSTVQSGNVCNLDLVSKIRKYHENFITKKNENRAPKALRQFFISLCFQINAECKMALINNLEYDTKDTITEDDYDQIRFLERHGATLLDFEEGLDDFDDIILLGESLGSSDSSGDQQQPSRIIVKTKTNSMIKNLIRTCELKFRPFYEKLIMPLIHLSNLGYNYKGELLERELVELKENKLVRRWYNILQTCEAFRALEIYEDQEASESMAGSEKQVLTFISPEEAEMLKKKQIQSIEDQAEEEAIKKPIIYEPIASHNDDNLWIKDQKELDRLVQKYKNSATESGRIKARVMKKILTKIKNTIKSGKIDFSASDLSTCNKRTNECETSKVDIKQDLIMMVDDAVANNEQQELAAKGIKSIDSEVAGFGGVPNVPRRNVGLPTKSRYIPKIQDQSKTSTKFGGWISKILPYKWDIFFTYVGISGFMMLVLGFMLIGVAG